MRGCVIVRPCGCYTLDGVLAHQCDRHADEGGKLAPNPELDAWLEQRAKNEPKAEK